MEILTGRREYFRVKLNSIYNDVNKWIQEKELGEELKNNILSEWHKNIKNVNKRLEEVWKNNIEGKRKAFKKGKEELIQYLNHQAKRKIKIKETEAAIIHTIWRDMINLITSSQKTSSALTINLTKKVFIAKNHQLIIVHIIKIAIIATK